MIVDFVTLVVVSGLLVVVYKVKINTKFLWKIIDKIGRINLPFIGYAPLVIFRNRDGNYLKLFKFIYSK